MLYYSDSLCAVYCGDCRDVLPTLGTFDLILTDPPYGVGLEYDEGKDDIEEWYKMMDQVIPLCRAHAKAVIMSAGCIEAERFIWNNHPPDWRLCWYKGPTASRCHVGFRQWEVHFVWGKCWKTPQPDFFNVRGIPKNTHGHPCPKSRKWASWLLSHFVTHGQTVCDCFAGSGTVLRECKDRLIHSVGIEKSQGYCQIIRNRLRQDVLPLDYKEKE